MTDAQIQADIGSVVTSTPRWETAIAHMEMALIAVRKERTDASRLVASNHIIMALSLLSPRTEAHK